MNGTGWHSTMVGDNKLLIRSSEILTMRLQQVQNLIHCSKGLIMLLLLMVQRTRWLGAQVNLTDQQIDNSGMVHIRWL